MLNKIFNFSEKIKLLNENKKLKEEIEALKERVIELEGKKKSFLKKCDFCSGEVVYTGYECSGITDIKCIKCGAKGFVNLMMR